MRFVVLAFMLLTSCSNKPHVHTNALIHEASPYLLQHAHNPVDWLPWGDAAFEKARVENKPVFLSIGYAACHWCHVMEHESFENEEIAEFLNEHFVAIKVDREERPDVDHHYMQAVQRMTGSGGWPLSVFLTAERKPFYGGTYWAPEAAYGRPGFMDVLKGLAKAWETERDSVLTSAVRLHDAIHEELVVAPAQSKLSPALLDSAVAESNRNFDPINGGFSRAPKFPHAMELAMLLRYYSRTGDDSVKHMVEFTLDKMARGGIFDQIGGGFHRYSTDEKWLVPHFEKMLYDNALLLQVYLAAHEETRPFGEWNTEAAPYRSRHGYVAGLTYGWIDRTLRLPGFIWASSLDADSEGEEGTFYTWTPEEIVTLLELKSANMMKEFCETFDITPEGNFEHGRSIPNTLLSRDIRLESDEFERLFDSVNVPTINTLRMVVGDARARRVPPARDDKALCDWNGLMISALAVRGETAVAHQTADHFLTPFERDGELVHSFLGDKELRIQLLADYAALGNGLLDLFCATGELRCFDGAYKLAEDIERRFAKGDGLYYMSEDSVAGVRSIDIYDSALPSGNSLAGNLFVKLYYLTGETKFRDRAEKQINALMPYLERMPTVFSQALLTAEWLVFPPDQAIVIYPLSEPRPSGRLPVHNRQVLYFDDKFVEQLPEGHPLSSLLEGKALLNGEPTIYLCRNFACDLPSNDFEEVRERMLRPWQN